MDYAKALPPTEQQSIARIGDQLKTLSLDQLFRLEMPDVCQAHIIQCGPLAPTMVKALVTNELSRRNAIANAEERADAKSDRNCTYDVSVASLIVSILAIGISLFPRRRKAVEA